MNKQAITLLRSLSQELNRLGVDIQANILSDFQIDKIKSGVFFDVKNSMVWLRIEIEDFYESDGKVIFENDIVNIKLEGGVVSLHCSLYSDLGIDTIALHHSEMNQFDSRIFANMEEQLTMKIKEHISFYMSRI